MAFRACMMKCSAGEVDDTILIKLSEASNTRHLVSKSVLVEKLQHIQKLSS